MMYKQACTASFLVFFSVTAFALGPVVEDGALPRVHNGSDRNDFVDLEIQSVGGGLSMSRRWQGDHWEWNTRWNALEMYNWRGGEWPVEPVEFKLTYNLVTMSESQSGGSGDGSGSVPSPCRLKLLALYDAFPYWVVRNGQTYVSRENESALEADNSGNIQGTLASCDSWNIPDPVLYNGEGRQIKVSNSGSRWEDRNGNVIAYDMQLDMQQPWVSGFDWLATPGRGSGTGRVEWYSRNGVKTRLHYVGNSDRVASVSDASGTLVEYAWEEYGPTNDKKHRLKALQECLPDTTPCTGRKVVYFYDDDTGATAAAQNRLIGVQHLASSSNTPLSNSVVATCYNHDATGQTPKWESNGSCAEEVYPQLTRLEYTGDNNRLVAYYAPQGVGEPERKTAVSIGTDGVLESRYTSDGVGGSYSYNYDKANRQYLIAVKDGHGTQTETWYTEFGEPIRKVVNGETLYSSVLKMSDDDTSTRPVSDQWKSVPQLRVQGSGGGSGGNKVSYNLNYVDDDKPPVHVQSATVTDAAGNITRKTFNKYGDVEAIRYPDGSVWKATFGDLSSPQEVVDEKGIRTRFTYGNGNAVASIREAVGTTDERLTTYEYYDPDPVNGCSGEAVPGEISQETVTYQGQSVVTQYQYDCRGNVTERREVGAGADNTDIVTIWSGHDGRGNPATMVDGNGNIWHYEYDANGNLTAEYEASLNRGWEYGYSVDGGIRSAKRFYVDEENETRAYGTAYTFKTNQAGQVTEMTDGLGARTVFEYDRAGRPSAVVDASGHSVFIGFNRDGRLEGVQDSAGNEVALTYQSGLPQTIVRKAGGALLSTETLGYDKRQRLDTTTVQDNTSNESQTRRQQPDVLGRILERVDAMNRSTRYDYDNLNRVKTLTAPDGGVTTLQYDLQDNITFVEDAAGNRTYYGYDKRGLLVSEQTGSNTAPGRLYRYDNNGNLVQAINALGQCTVYGYTTANEPLSQTVYDNATGSSITDCDSNTSPVRTITYSYDDYGRYDGYSDGETTVAYVYEEGTDRLASVSTHFLSIWNNPNTVDDESKKTVQYRYDPNGQLKELINPEGRTYRYSYDAAGRVTGMSLGPDGRVDVDGYLWDKPVNITYRNSGGNEAASETHMLDGFLRRQTASYTTPVSSSINLAYTYNPENHIKTINGHPQGNLTYGYDAADRLTSAVRAGQQTESENFSYDNAHNRLTYVPSPSGGEGAPSGAGEGSYSYSQANDGLLESITANTVTTTFTHDANGHRTHKTGADTWQYDYNAQERLQSIKKNNIEQATYAYNAQGQRIRKTANGTTTFYLYNPMGLAAEYDSNGNLQREYGYLPGQPYMTNPLFMRNSSGLYFYRNDHLGTPQQLVDGLGNLVWQARYNAFGKATIEVEMIENNLRLAGQYYDSESNLHQNWFRDYDPETGRYLQRDPIGLNGGINTYGYANANPVLFTDPTGEIGVYGGIVGVAVGIATSYMMGCDYDPGDLAIDFAMGFMGANLGKMGNLRRAYHAGLNKAKDMGLTPYQAWGWRRGLGDNLKQQTPGKRFIYRWNEWRYKDKGDKYGPFFDPKSMDDVNKTLTDTNPWIDPVKLVPKSPTISAGLPVGARGCACE